MNEQVPDWSDVTSGVLQRRVLGPILFLCCINVLLMTQKSTLKLTESRIARIFKKAWINSVIGVTGRILSSIPKNAKYYEMERKMPHLTIFHHTQTQGL